METKAQQTNLSKTLLKAGLAAGVWFVASPLSFSNNWSLIGVQEWLEHRIFGRREQRLTTCPSCNGTGVCAGCDGKGCVKCNGDGHCAQCHGEGNLITGIGTAMSNR